MRFLIGFICFVLFASSVQAQTLKVGVLATLEGAFQALGEDAMRGLEMALAEVNSQAGGLTIEIEVISTDTSATSAFEGVTELVDARGLDIVIGPVSGDEGLVVRDFAKTRPGVTFINGLAGAQDITLREPADNFFRFSTDGAQWNAGLGEYAYKTKGYRNVAVISEDYSFAYTNSFGFMLPFCNAGGNIAARYWVPIGTQDYSSIVASMPNNIDAIFVALGGSDAVNFLQQYQASGGTKPLIAGTITIDGTVLSAEGDFKNSLAGTPSAGPIGNLNTPEWQEFVNRYNAMFPDGFGSPSLFAHGYYLSAKAFLLSLEKVNGDLSNNHAALRNALSTLEFSTPTGLVSIDHNRNGVADIFLSELALDENGNLFSKLVEVVPQVNQTLGVPEAEFLALGPVGRGNPSCAQ